MTQVIQGFHGIDIQAYAFFPKELFQLGVTASALMSRYIKGDYSLFSESLKCFIHRSMLLCFYVHSRFQAFLKI